MLKVSLMRKKNTKMIRETMITMVITTEEEVVEASEDLEEVAVASEEAMMVADVAADHKENKVMIIKKMMRMRVTITLNQFTNKSPREVTRRRI